MPDKIFVSYRRDDVPGDARGIRDALAAKFGKASVFMDVDDLQAGQRFDRELEKALSACGVLIAIIGPRWLDILKARQDGDERDFVRDEIANALKRGLVVIPARVGNENRLPELPRAADLPEDIRDLVLHQKHDITHERFGRDVGGLIEAVREARKGRRSGGPRSTLAVVRDVTLAIAGALFLIFVVGIWLSPPSSPPATSGSRREPIKGPAEVAKSQRDTSRLPRGDPPAPEPGDRTKAISTSGIILDTTGQSASQAKAALPTEIVTPPGGYIAIVSSQKTRADALKVYADLQQKHWGVLAGKAPFVQEVDLGGKGIWFRVGPPPFFTRDAATEICNQLVRSGYGGCWVANN